MDTYEYKGRNKRGELLKGTIESASPQSVATWLIAAGIYPVHIKLHDATMKQQPKWLQELQTGGSLTPKDLILFTRQMGTMVKSGVPMIDAFAGLQKSSRNQKLAIIIKDIRENLEKGLNLSGALSRHPEFFDAYYVSMVKVGEGTGQLEEIFRRLYEQLNFQNQIRNKIKSALRYPMFVLFAIMVAVSVMTLFVIPKFAHVYSRMHADLPFLTKILLGSSQFAQNYWWLVLGGLGFLFYGARVFVRTPEGRYQWDKLKLKIPVVGSILQKAALARFCQSFAIASKSGVPLVQAFSLVSRVVENAFYEERILLMRDGVERGDSILRCAQTANIFTQLELQMISIGEETGDIDSMLSQVAELYQEEVDYEVSRLSESIEPILLTFMGILVLILMLGIFMPMWKLGQVATMKH